MINTTARITNDTYISANDSASVTSISAIVTNDPVSTVNSTARITYDSYFSANTPEKLQNSPNEVKKTKKAGEVSQYVKIIEAIVVIFKIAVFTEV